MRFYINHLFVLIFSLLLPIIAVADEEISSLYKQHGIEGALIIASLEGDVVYVHNSERAQRRFFPASTFKIPNTLIGMEGSNGSGRVRSCLLLQVKSMDAMI
ncbi:MAG TPA: hypothetical protein EYQ42_08815 [Thiotrichaceae bacterium]|jgi:beta-lactamase class D|nr:hypothetical protein [Thiotrichaceae bacterium]